jgi:hypothetical protein
MQSITCQTVPHGRSTAQLKPTIADCVLKEVAGRSVARRLRSREGVLTAD